MKEINAFNEDDFRYKEFELSDKELKNLSEYCKHNFDAEKTHLICIYDFMGKLATVQVNEDTTIELTPEEFENLFCK